MDILDKTEPEIYFCAYTTRWLYQGLGPSQRQNTQPDPTPAYLTACAMLLGISILGRMEPYWKHKLWGYQASGLSQVW